MNEVQKKIQQRSRVKLVILFSIFLLPIIVAYVLYKNPQWQPGSSKNNGILFNPVVIFSSFDLQTMDGKKFSAEQLRGKWSLIYIGKQTCDEICKQTLLKAMNGLIAQGREASRINYYYIVNADKFDADRSAMAESYPRLVFLKGDKKQRAMLLPKFSVGKEHKVGDDDRLYLLDPAGVLLMHYPSGFKDLGLMEDLKHLLKWSQIG